jgi:hypothetical protein
MDVEETVEAGLKGGRSHQAEEMRQWRTFVSFDVALLLETKMDARQRKIRTSSL